MTFSLYLCKSITRVRVGVVYRKLRRSLGGEKRRKRVVKTTIEMCRGYEEGKKRVRRGVEEAKRMMTDSEGWNK